MVKKSSGLSRLARPPSVNEDDMSKVTRQQADELRRLGEKPEAEIDTEDMPELTDWSDAQRGVFYRPLKKQITLRLDADVLAWFRAQGDRYQTRINEALREYIKNQQR